MDIKKNKLAEAEETEVVDEPTAELPEVDVEEEATPTPTEGDEITNNLILSFLQQKTQEAVDIDTFIANITDEKIKEVLTGLKADTLRHIGALQAIVAHAGSDGAEIDAARQETAEVLGDATETAGEGDADHEVPVIEPVGDDDGEVDLNDLSNITIEKTGEGDETENTEEDEFAIDGEEDEDALEADADEEPDDTDEDDDKEKEEGLKESFLTEEKLSLTRLNSLRDDNNGAGEEFQKYIQKVCGTIGKDLDGNKFKFYGKGKGVVIEEMFEDAISKVKTGGGQELLNKAITEYINREYPFLQFVKTDIQQISTVKLVNVKIFLAIKGEGEDMKQNEALDVLDAANGGENKVATIDDIKDSLVGYYGATDVKVDGNTITGNIEGEGKQEVLRRLKAYGFADNGNGEYATDDFNGCKATVTFAGNGFTFVMDCKKNEALEEELTIESGIESYEPWSGAVDTWNRLVDNFDIATIDDALEKVFPDGCSATELNDYLWFNSADIYARLGLDEDGNSTGEEAEVEPVEDDEDDFEDVTDDEPITDGLKVNEFEGKKKSYAPCGRKTESLKKTTKKEPKKELTLEEKIALEDAENEKVWARFSKNAR